MAIEWETPDSFFNALNAEFNFTLDVCALPFNAKVPRYFSPAENGLIRDWTNEVCWMNPPYDKTGPLWLQKAYSTAQQGGTVVALVQARQTDSKVFHSTIMLADEIRFVRDRVYFGNPQKQFYRSNHSSMVVVFRPYCQGPPKISSMDNYKPERTAVLLPLLEAMK